jgi:hypothetical protein
MRVPRYSYASAQVARRGRRRPGQRSLRTPERAWGFFVDQQEARGMSGEFALYFDC